ncbi:aromatic ring-hydroxylating dioxygenase subunit alpha [Rhodopseudomonas palustris]|uniref:Aromatic ring-hydroxylating dioxygenase subunit alpha n=1 Tax=Rhodopseudomonas palustris TaxID=1076 RepID=A0A418V0P9_RHOPL|nr:aromatic ring-hydroxylating dioxygenase subunit alpha [Rhodopseudomonas palustris]RJF69408.1 aromatic ring-hydroxylating dioxygenase subunit alpha [Rhodopseudomonas palustris]
MFLRNHWYVAARSEELGRSLLARRILNEPVLLYRTGAGEAVAIEDRCCHRNVPLSIGKLVNDDVQCGYHGLVFDRAGRCISMPGQEKIPAAARIKSFPLIERWQMVWIWMGDPALADEARLPDFSIIDREGWAAVGARVDVKANYLYGVDNLLDLSHLSYVHGRTIGTLDVARHAVTTTRQGDTVKVTRWMHDVPPPPTFVKLGGFDSNIDRWQIATAAPPCYVWLEVGGAKVGTGAMEGNRSQGIERWNLNVVTPETDKTAHLFWTEVRNFKIDDPDTTQLLKAQIDATLEEDAEVLAAQQLTMDLLPHAKTVDIAFDAGSVAFRRTIDRMLREETAAQPDRSH